MADTSLTVALTGATGFVGRHVVPHLLERGHRVRVLVRNPDKFKSMDPRVEVYRGDLFNAAAVGELVHGAQAVIHLVGIIMEKPGDGQTFERIHTQGTINLLDAAKGSGSVKRWIQMSALGVRPDAVARYHSSKWAAEEAVRQSGLEWTIVRPSIIHGPDGEFVALVRDFWGKAFPPFVPFFSRETSILDGIQAGLALAWPLPSLSRPPRDDRYVSSASAGLLQPVWVEDVARVFAGALTNRVSVHETYPLGGPEAVTWQQLYLAFRRYLPLARNKKIVSVPAWYAKMIAGLPGVPFNWDQVVMSQEDSTCQIAKVQTDFGFQLAPLEPTIAEYASQIPA